MKATKRSSSCTVSCAASTGLALVSGTCATSGTESEGQMGEEENRSQRVGDRSMVEKTDHRSQ